MSTPFSEIWLIPVATLWSASKLSLFCSNACISAFATEAKVQNKPYVEPQPPKSFKIQNISKIVKIFERTGDILYSVLFWNIYAQKISWSFLYNLSSENSAINSARMSGWEIMSPPIKCNIDYCLTQSPSGVFCWYHLTWL